MFVNKHVLGCFSKSSVGKPRENERKRRKEERERKEGPYLSSNVGGGL